MRNADSMSLAMANGGKLLLLRRTSDL